MTETHPTADERPRVALVTGGSRGIGAATVRALHRDGFAVVVHYGRDAAAAEALADELGAGVAIVGVDLGEVDAGERCWRAASASFGRIDVLVNNAGAWLPSDPADDQAWRAGWEANLALNLVAPADLCRSAIASWATRGGIIVNVTSRSAHRGDDAGHLAYGAAKGGLLALTRGIARGFGDRGVLAYAVAPGWVGTDLAGSADLVGLVDALPLREITPPEDVAEVIAFLASGRARHATGTTIDITGADYVR